jgi:hypothetical protein
MNSFVPATIKLWNYYSLPEDTVNSSSIRSFKNNFKNPEDKKILNYTIMVNVKQISYIANFAIKLAM